MKKKLISLILALLVVFSLSAPALAASPLIKNIEYQGAGVVEVDFSKKLVTLKTKVSVKDADGNSYSVKITERDGDDLDFTVKGLKANTKYTVTITGLKADKSGTARKATASFKTPKTEFKIRDVEYDRGDKELDIDFFGRMQYKKVKVSVTDKNGKTYTCRIEEKDRDGMELFVSGLKKGKTYTVTITGIRLRGTSSYGKLSATFTA